MLTLVALAVIATGSSSSNVDGDVFIAGICGAVITGVVTYVVKRRGTSGTVKTSDAVTIFKEGDNIRKWLTDTLTTERAERAVERAADQQTISNLQTQVTNMGRRINILERTLRTNGVEVPT